MRIEQIINEGTRAPLYNYYLSLGYDHKTAASLALFTYGQYRFKEFSMDDLYAAVSKGDEYLPKEVIEERERRKIFYQRRMNPGLDPDRTIDPFEMFSDPVYADGMVSPETHAGARTAPLRRGGAGTAEMMCAEPLAAMDYVAADADVYEDGVCESYSMSPMMSKEYKEPGILDIAGALGFAADEYETIEEKDARSTAVSPSSCMYAPRNSEAPIR